MSPSPPLYRALPLALLAGLALPLGLSPFDLQPLALLAPLLLLMALYGQPPGRALLLGYAFGLAKYGLGVSWVYVSIHEHGGAPPGLAAALVVLFVAFLALFPALAAALLARLLVGRDAAWRWALGFAAIWVLQEWLLTWVLTGFPWLLLGYGFLSGPLAGWMPVLGVLGTSLIASLVAALLWLVASSLWRRDVGPAAGAGLVVLLLGGVGAGLGVTSWTRPAGAALDVAVVQGNVAQVTKWRADMARPILQGYLDLSSSNWDADLLVWPEAAVTYFANDSDMLLRRLGRQAAQHDATIVLGIPAWQADPEDGRRHFLNTAMALGRTEGRYVKHRLVPFGEYVPLEGLLRGLIGFFDLPMSHARPGPARQAPLPAGDYRIAMAICYEIVYPELVRRQARDAEILVTLSNDTWFGDSLGPAQHLQMAQARAVETGRPLVRATNDGFTALVDARGRVLQRLPRFEVGVLRGAIVPMTGATPFLVLGHAPTLLLALGLLLAAWRLPGLGWRQQRAAA